MRHFANKFLSLLFGMRLVLVADIDKKMLLPLHSRMRYGSLSLTHCFVPKMPGQKLSKSRCNRRDPLTGKVFPEVTYIMIRFINKLLHDDTDKISQTLTRLLP